jgi:HEPN domain-containing protein
MQGTEAAGNTALNQFDAKSVADYWLTEAEESLRVAEHLVEKADYSYALFFGHLAVEKSLKALYALRFKEHAPPIHNLLRLARIVDLALDEARADALIRITAFNIEARYPDMKRDFRRACTPEYTEQQIAVIKEMLEWLQFQQV